MTEDQTTELADRRVAEYLEGFKGDTLAAVHAIRDYTQRERSRTSMSSKAASYGPTLISVRDVTKSYRIGKRKVNALNGVSLDVYQGEFLVLSGESGSGKSTLMQLMGGLDKPTTGEIIVDGVNINQLKDAKLAEFRNKTVGFVFQFFFLQPFLRLNKNIEVPAMFANSKRKDRLKRVEELIEEVGLSQRAVHYPKELSGGQLQRAAISRALLNNPKILLADEPTGNLDSANSKEIIGLFEYIRKEMGMTIVVVTHDPEIAARADRVVRISDGMVV